MRVCNGCKVNKPTGEFYFSKSRGKIDGLCKNCYSVKNKAWVKSNPDKVSELRRKHIAQRSIERKANPNKERAYFRKSLYGITEEEFIERASSQDWECKYCRTEITMASPVDHNHTTKEFRAVLCTRCNLILGIIEKNRYIVERMLLDS